MKSQARAQGTYFPWPWRNASQSGGLLSVNARLSGRKGREQAQGIQGSRTKARFCDRVHKPGRCWFGREDRDSTMILGLMGMIRVATCDSSCMFAVSVCLPGCWISSALSAARLLVCSLSLSVCLSVCLLCSLLLSLLCPSPNRFAVTSATGVTIRDNTHSSDIGGLGLTHGRFAWSGLG